MNAPIRDPPGDLRDLADHSYQAGRVPGKWVCIQDSSHLEEWMAEKATGLLVVMIEIDPGHEEKFMRWYHEAHFPERLESPGVLDSEDGKRIFPLSDWGLQVSQHFTKMVAIFTRTRQLRSRPDTKSTQPAEPRPLLAGPSCQTMA